LKLVSDMYSVSIFVRERGFGRVLCGQIGTTFHVRHPLFDTHFGVYHESASWRLAPDAAAADGGDSLRDAAGGSAEGSSRG
jgi:hypothetical protein